MLIMDVEVAESGSEGHRELPVRHGASCQCVRGNLQSGFGALGQDGLSQEEHYANHKTAVYRYSPRRR